MGTRAVLGVWALLAFLMSLNGIFRETVLASLFRRGIADLLGTTGTFFRAFPEWRRTNPLRLAAIWTALTIAFEFIFGHYVDRKSWSELAANYQVWEGRLWPLVLLSLVLAPFLWIRVWPARRR